MHRTRTELVMALFALCLVSGICHRPGGPVLERINVSHNPGDSRNPSAVADPRDTIRLCSVGEERTT